MTIYLLERLGRIGWDENRSIVVRADDETQAREVAAKNAADEGPEVWRNPGVTTCEVVDPDAEVSDVIAIDFNAG